MSGFSNQPRILRGAFVEYGLSLPPLIVVFQFNPEQLTRNRSLYYSAPSSSQTAGRAGSLRDFHKQFDDLTDLQAAQVVSVQEESISFEIRLDASDKLDEGDTITEQFGVAPQLATLELMVHPKDESLLGQALGSLLGEPQGFSLSGASSKDNRLGKKCRYCRLENILVLKQGMNLRLQNAAELFAAPISVVICE